MESDPQLEDPGTNNVKPVDTQPGEDSTEPYAITDFKKLVDMIVAQGGKITHVDVDLEPSRETKTINLVDGYL